MFATGFQLLDDFMCKTVSRHSSQIRLFVTRVQNSAASFEEALPVTRKVAGMCRTVLILKGLNFFEYDFVGWRDREDSCACAIGDNKPSVGRPVWFVFECHDLPLEVELKRCRWKRKPCAINSDRINRCSSACRFRNSRMNFNQADERIARGVLVRTQS
jgi:hypothetical protein